MAAIKPLNVLYIASKTLKQGRQVVVDENNADGVESALVREGGTDGDAQHLLDQSFLDYKQEASKRVSSTEDVSAKCWLDERKRATGKLRGWLDAKGSTKM